jgi:hypothetical protein
MTQEQIEGNKLIIDFLDVPLERNGMAYYIHKGYYGITGLLFHRSWDWIIPAVNKFINETVPPTESKDINEYRDYCNRLHNLVTDYKILPVFNCLAKAIKWYNQTKQL